MKRKWWQRKRVLVSFASIVVGLGFAWFDQYQPAPDRSSPEYTENEEPDYYGDGLQHREYDAKGRVQQSFTAKRSEHYPNLAITHFFMPHIITTTDEGKQWQIDALKGHSKDKDKLLTLIDQVTAKPLNVAPSDELLIESPLMLYHSDTQIAETDQPVQITSPNGRINAIGMQLNVSEQILDLHKQVKTRYAPPPNPQ
ncbi:MAG: LPS export ABC transporter periplasmic protein LptC [Venatoribacter sp.]